MDFELRSVVGQRVDSNNLSSPKERRILSHRPTTHCLLGTTQWLSLCCAPLRRPASAVVSQRVELSLYKENDFAVLRARHRRRGTGYRRVNCGNWGWGRSYGDSRGLSRSGDARYECIRPYLPTPFRQAATTAGVCRCPSVRQDRSNIFLKKVSRR